MAVSVIPQDDSKTMAQVRALLEREGITLDANLDATCCIFDDEYRPIATGSCFGNTLRCFAVDSGHQGEGLLNEIVTWLIQFEADRGFFHLFLYTKCDTAKFFGDLGFHEIARVENKLVFMENRRTGFSSWLKKLQRAGAPRERTAALVMNANPFTLGHQFLVEKAAAENDVVHLFAVSEDRSLVPFDVRRRLLREGTAHLPNVIHHDSGPYIISSATFPSYFLKDEDAVIDGHARLDVAVFRRIAETLGIGRRYVGEEPSSRVTGAYNRIMGEELPKAGIEVVVVPRLELDGKAISASTVRVCLQNGDLETLRTLVPSSTLRYFASEEALPVLCRIREAGNVIHY